MFPIKKDKSSYKKKENIDLNKRNFIKKSVLGLAGIGGMVAFSKLTKAWSILGFGDGTTQTTASVGGGQQSVQVFTVSGTWTKPTGLKFAEITCTGGGGGAGSNIVGTDGGGGGAGGTSIKFITATLLGATETVTIGAGGIGGAAGASHIGTAGGTSSFGAICSATGGVIVTNSAMGGPGGVGVGGDLNLTGGGGAAWNRRSDGSVMGGSSFFGGGGYGAGSIQVAGNGTNGGGGASGANGRVAGDGGSGIILVKEFY